MRVKLVGNKADSKIQITKNADTVVIPRGAPVCLKLTGTAAGDDGLSVVLPSTALAAGATAFPYGVATRDMAVGDVGEAIVSGVARYALVTVLTRSATSANWPAIAAVAAGAILQLDPVNNGFLVAAASQPAANFLPFAVLLDAIASAPTSASSSSGPTAALLAVATGYRVFVRML